MSTFPVSRCVLNDLAVFGGYTARVKNAIGDRLRRAREDGGWSLDDVAGESGVSRDTVNRIELGKRKPHRSTAKSIDDALSRLSERRRAASVGGARGTAGLEDHLAAIIAHVKTLKAGARRDFIRAVTSLLAALEHASGAASTGTDPNDDR